MKPIPHIAAALALAISPPLPAKPLRAGTERVIDAADPYLTVLVDNKPMKMRVDFDGPADIFLLNPVAGARIRLRSPDELRGILEGSAFRPGALQTPQQRPLQGSVPKGSLTVDGQFIQVETGSVLLRLEGEGGMNLHDPRHKDCQRELLGFGIVHRSISQIVAEGDADGVIGLECLPEDKVTLRFHTPLAGERTIEMPVLNVGSLLTSSIKLGDRFVRIRYAPQEPLTVATAGAAAHMAALRDGRWSGPPTRFDLQIWQEAPTSRPSRAMTLGRPLSLSGLPLKGFIVRTSDGLGTYQLPPNDLPARAKEASPDPDSIVVTGKKVKPKKRDKGAVLLLTLGRDVLGGCSSVTYDKIRMKMIFRCI